jgi:hypothetical protein
MAQAAPETAGSIEVDAAINQVAAQRPDGMPLDQAEKITTDPWAGTATVPQTIQTSASTEQNLLPSSASSPRERAQQYLQQRFEELGAVVPGRYRRERVMGQDPDIVEGIELYASTGDPSTLQRLAKNPATPVSVNLREQSEFINPDVATSKLYSPAFRDESVGDLFEKDIVLTNKISELGLQKQKTLNRISEIEDMETQLRFAGASDPYYTRMYNKLQAEKQTLDPSVFNADLGDALAERDFIRTQLDSLESLGTQYKLTPRQEGMRPFYQQTPEGQIIEETFEVRGGRPSVGEGVVEQAASGGGIRGRVGQYDPDSQLGSSIGIYGIEPRDFPIADETLRPTALQAEETKVRIPSKPEGITFGYRKMMNKRGLEITQADEEKARERLREYTEERRRVSRATPEERLSSVNMSEAILKASRQQGNRNPRGGVLPDEITTLRRQMAQPVQTEEVSFGPRPAVAPGTVPPQQLGLKGVTGYAARRVDTPADLAANQLEAYMTKLQRGRSTPLTSQAVIQPRLF